MACSSSELWVTGRAIAQSANRNSRHVQYDRARKCLEKITGTDRVSFGAVQVCIIARRPPPLKYVQGWVRRAGDAFAAHFELSLIFIALEQCPIVPVDDRAVDISHRMPGLGQYTGLGRTRIADRMSEERA